MASSMLRGANGDGWLLPPLGGCAGASIVSLSIGQLLFYKTTLHVRSRRQGPAGGHRFIGGAGRGALQPLALAPGVDSRSRVMLLLLYQMIEQPFQIVSMLGRYSFANRIDLP